MLSFEAFVHKIPLNNTSRDNGASENEHGSWLGYYLRMAVTYFVTPEEARVVVARAIGPGHDYVPLGRDETFGYEYATSGGRRILPKLIKDA